MAVAPVIQADDGSQWIDPSQAVPSDSVDPSTILAPTGAGQGTTEPDGTFDVDPAAANAQTAQVLADETPEQHAADDAWAAQQAQQIQAEQTMLAQTQAAAKQAATDRAAQAQMLAQANKTRDLAQAQAKIDQANAQQKAREEAAHQTQLNQAQAQATAPLPPQPQPRVAPGSVGPVPGVVQPSVPRGGNGNRRGAPAPTGANPIVQNVAKSTPPSNHKAILIGGGVALVGVALFAYFKD